MKRDPFGYESEKEVPDPESLGADATAETFVTVGMPPLYPGHNGLSLEDYNAHVGRLEKAMQDAPHLLQFLRDVRPTDAKLRRMPFGLINRSEPNPRDGHTSEMIAPGSTGSICFSPDVTMRPRFMVLSEETAEAFNILQFTVCNIGHVPSPIPLPLETFSVKYYAACARDDKALQRLIDIQQWGSYECTPANRIMILIQNMSALPRQFRGILWADIVDIF